MLKYCMAAPAGLHGLLTLLQAVSTSPQHPAGRAQSTTQAAAGSAASGEQADQGGVSETDSAPAACKARQQGWLPCDKTK